MIEEAFSRCDAVILSGGVSVGDFDCTPEAMERAGVRILVHGLALKPGMAGAYGIYEKKRGEADASPIPVFGLSGNPAACMTAFYALVLPVLRRQMGIASEACCPRQIRVRLAKDFSRKNQSALLLRGKVDLSASVQQMEITGGQGNQVLSSLAGSNAFAEIPAGMAVGAQGETDAFLIGEF